MLSTLNFRNYLWHLAKAKANHRCRRWRWRRRRLAYAFGAIISLCQPLGCVAHIVRTPELSAIDRSHATRRTPIAANQPPTQAEQWRTQPAAAWLLVQMCTNKYCARHNNNAALVCSRLAHLHTYTLCQMSNTSALPQYDLLAAISYAVRACFTCVLSLLRAHANNTPSAQKRYAFVHALLLLFGTLSLFRQPAFCSRA